MKSIKEIDKAVQSIENNIQSQCKLLIYNIRWKNNITDHDTALAAAMHEISKTKHMSGWQSQFATLISEITKTQQAPSWWAHGLVGTNATRSFERIFNQTWRMMGKKPVK